MENNSRYFNKISRKYSDLGNNSMRKIFFNHKKIYSYYTNSNTVKKGNSFDRKIDISVVEKQDKIYAKRYDNRLKPLIHGVKKSFCYFKIVNNDNHVLQLQKFLGILMEKFRLILNSINSK